MMNTRSHKHSASLVLLTLALLAVITSACSIQIEPMGSITQVVDVSLDEQLFNQSEPTFTVHGHSFWEGLLEDADRIELHDGYIRVLGLHRQPDGSRVDGSLDLSLTAVDGMLDARIIAVNVPGVTLADPLIQDMNSELKVDLTHVMYDHGTHVYFQDVKITEDVLQIKILVDIKL